MYNLISLLIKDVRAASNPNQSITSSHPDTLTKTKGELVQKIDVISDVRFITEGPIGLERECIALEKKSVPGKPVRMGVFGHLPSHIRHSTLTPERGDELFKNWEPLNMIDEYIRLVNERQEAMLNFLESGRICRETYEQDKIEQYVYKHRTDLDEIEDPPEEVEE